MLEAQGQKYRAGREDPFCSVHTHTHTVRVRADRPVRYQLKFKKNQSVMNDFFQLLFEEEEKEEKDRWFVPFIVHSRCAPHKLVANVTLCSSEYTLWWLVGHALCPAGVMSSTIPFQLITN